MSRSGWSPESVNNPTLMFRDHTRSFRTGNVGPREDALGESPKWAACFQLGRHMWNIGPIGLRNGPRPRLSGLASPNN